MDRLKKIELLNDLQSGKVKISEIFNKVEITLHYVSERHAYDLDRNELINISEVERYIDNIKKGNPNSIVNICIITKEQFDRISNDLENEY